MKNSSKYFSEKELHCRCGCGTKGMSEDLLAKLDNLRESFNKPLTLTSARRCMDHNKASGGAVSSQHLTGNAVDISWANMSGTDKQILLQLALKLFPGVGLHKQFLHVDSRKATPLIFFY